MGGNVLLGKGSGGFKRLLAILMMLSVMLSMMLQAKEMMEQRKAARAVRAAQLDAQIAEQRAAITKMETELEASGQVLFRAWSILCMIPRTMIVLLP